MVIGCDLVDVYVYIPEPNKLFDKNFSVSHRHMKKKNDIFLTSKLLFVYVDYTESFCENLDFK